MSLHDKNTIKSREEKAKKGAGFLFNLMFSAIPFLGVVLTFAVLVGVIGAVFTRSKTIAQDIVIPLLCAIAYFGFHYAAYKNIQIPGVNMVSTFFVISPVVVVIISGFAYKNGFD